MTVETLKNELIQSNEDADAAHSELEQLRLHAFDSEKQTNDEANERDLLLREVQEDLERVKIEREEWESEAMRERVRREEMQQIYGQLEMELATAKTERENLREERDREQESAANLHAVLEEFQAGARSLFSLSSISFDADHFADPGHTAKDRELQSLLGDLQNQLHDATESLAYYKQQAADAQVSHVAM